MKDRALSIARDEKTELRKKNVLREYLQHVILRELFDLEVLEKLVFHGGTALRILHGLERFSENLDFHSRYPNDEIKLAPSLEQLEKRLYRQGYDVSFSPVSEVAVQSSFLKFGELLYELNLSPHENEKLRIKLEVDTNPPHSFSVETSPVSEFFTFVVHHHDRPSFVAGKLHAMLERSWAKGRDFFDLMFYLTRWPETLPNFKYLNAALRQTDWDGPTVSEDNWKRLCAERAEKIDWDDLREDVAPFALRSSDLKAFRRDLLLSELRT